MAAPKRKGAARRADIPPQVLAALNAGREETATLVEWLAIDMTTLVSHVAPQVGLTAHTHRLVQHAAHLSGEGITARMRGMGQALFDAMRKAPNRDDSFRSLAAHPSDMARAWAAYVVHADAALSLEERLAQCQRFAADASAMVRECAWDSFRPHVAADLGAGLVLLQDWVVHADPNVRRCAVEGTRPRGVWTSHIAELKADPALALALLQPVRSDPSRYVQTAVANWMNDASKSAPEWAAAVTGRWLVESPTVETRWIVNRGMRTLRKKGVDLPFLA